MVTVKGNVVEFTFYRPQAGSLHLVGDFNGWREHELSMQRGSDGYWRAALTLPAGTYKFRYRADGRWFTDFAAFGVEKSPFGWDSVVRVEEAHKAAPAPKPAVLAMPRRLPAAVPVSAA